MKIICAEQFQLNRTADMSAQQDLDKTVLEIIANVRMLGDEALYAYTKDFDHVELKTLTVQPDEWRAAEKQIDASFLSALNRAKENITAFHREQKEKSWFIQPEPGILLGQQVTAIERVGIYVPGGKAAYPSTVLMNAIPALLAGVTSISVTTPPRSDGTVSPYVLAACAAVGIKQVYKVGGAQAIAALAYGTETIDWVSKIVGPGNAYVARAKKWVYGDVAIDMIAGPSEICIVADETANPAYVAADLLSQAEHDEQAVPICITTNAELAQAVQQEVERQIPLLERQEIIRASISKQGSIIIAGTRKKALETANEIASEHLQLMIDNPEEGMTHIRHAGAIFLGHYSPEPLGDYMAGPNHTLPTSGTAAFSSPLGVYDFIKRSSIIRYNQQQLDQASEAIITLAEKEGLGAHANAIRIRKE